MLARLHIHECGLSLLYNPHSCPAVTAEVASAIWCLFRRYACNMLRRSEPSRMQLVIRSDTRFLQPVAWCPVRGASSTAAARGLALAFAMRDRFELEIWLEFRRYYERRERVRAFHHPVPFGEPSSCFMCASPSPFCPWAGGRSFLKATRASCHAFVSILLAPLLKPCPLADLGKLPSPMGPPLKMAEFGLSIRI